MDSDDAGSSRRYLATAALVLCSVILAKVLYAAQGGSAQPSLVDWGDWAVWLRLIGCGMCLVGIAFCSLSEIALVSVNRSRIKKLAQEGNARAQVVRQMFEDPSVDYLSTLVVMINVFVLLLSNMMTWVWLHTGNEQYLKLATAGTIVLVLLFGEIMPKSYGAHSAEAIALRVGPWIARAARSLFARWVVGLVTLLTRPVLRLFRLDSVPGRRFAITAKELRVMTDMGQEEGVLEADEAQLLDSIISFTELTVREIMTPRVDVVAIEADQPLSEAIKLIAREGRSRIPVYEENLDNVIGILYANDILRAICQGRSEATIRELMRPPLRVPESKRIDELLRELQQKKVHLALVIDEHGGLDGVVTIEDILEEIVGEVVDEHDNEVAEIRQISEDTWMIAARAPRHDVEQALGIELPEGDFDTIGGFIIESLQTLPDPGQSVVHQGFKFEVASTEGPRIKQVRARRLSAEEASQLEPGGTPAA